MFTIHIETNDKRGCRIFGQALIDYASADGPPVTGDIVLDDAPAPFTPTVEPLVEDAPTPPVVEDDADQEPASQTGLVTPPTGQYVETDAYGVAFDPEYCAKSDKPYYTTGPREGQWKKKRGLANDVYDTWHAEAKLKAQSAAPLPPAPEPPNVEAAFKGEPAAPPPATVTEAVAADVPTDAGSLMAWVAEMQTAQRLTQGDVDTAYATSGVTPGDLFSGAEGAVSALYNALTASLK